MFHVIIAMCFYMLLFFIYYYFVFLFWLCASTRSCYILKFSRARCFGMHCAYFLSLCGLVVQVRATEVCQKAVCAVSCLWNKFLTLFLHLRPTHHLVHIESRVFNAHCEDVFSELWNLRYLNQKPGLGIQVSGLQI